MAEGTAIITKTKAKELAAQYEDFADETSNLQKDFLKFAKQGQFVHGTDEVIVEDVEEFAINMSTLARGFICWKSNEVVDEQMMLVSDKGQAIQKEDLIDHGPYESDMDGWRNQAQVDMRSLESGRGFVLERNLIHAGPEVDMLSFGRADKRLAITEVPQPTVLVEG